MGSKKKQPQEQKNRCRCLGYESSGENDYDPCVCGHDIEDHKRKACNFTRCGCEDCESVRAALRDEVAPGSAAPCAPTGGEK